MKWVIDKSFDFCYGHRVWSQTLEKKFSLDGCLECRHLHGHQGKITIFLESEKLERGMVTDFKHLGWFKEWLNSAVDHKFIIDKNDPLFFDLMSHYSNSDGKMDVKRFHRHKEGYWTPKLELLENLPDVLLEKYQGIIVVDFVPTSEELSAWFLQIIKREMKPLGVTVKAVEFWETPKSHCRAE